MVVKLLPEQISEYWEVVKYAIENSLPPIANEASDKMNRILESLINDSMQCWVMYKEENEVRRLQVVCITSLLQDFCSGTNNLLIYSLFGFSEVTEDEWKDGFEILSIWGRSFRCSRIIAYTDVDRIKEIVSKLGGESKYSLVSIPL